MVLSMVLVMVGIVRSKWLRFGGKRPGCLTIIAIAVILLVIGLSEAGEVRAAGMKDVDTVRSANVLSGAAYLVSDVARQCEPGTKSGRAGGSDDERLRWASGTWSKHRLTTMQAWPIRYSWSMRRRGPTDISQKTLCI